MSANPPQRILKLRKKKPRNQQQSVNVENILNLPLDTYIINLSINGETKIPSI